MITILLVTLLIISLVFNILFVVLCRTILFKIGVYESWILNIKTSVIDTIEKMREIDREGIFSSGIDPKSGLFESNDPTSAIFKQLLSLVEELETIVK